MALVEPLQPAEPKAEALRFSGVVRSVTTTQLSFEVAGRIERILIDEGTRVRRGQALAQLDRTDYRLQMREAEARLRQLEADLARKRTLLAEGILAPPPSRRWRPTRWPPAWPATAPSAISITAP